MPVHYPDNPEHLSQQSNVSSVLSSQESITDSQISEASILKISRLESLNTFLAQCDVSPIKKLTNPLTVSSDRTKKRYLEKAKQCISVVLETVSPNEGEILWKSILADQEKKEDLENDQSLNVLKEIYSKGETWQFRRQVLSIIVQQMSFEEAQEFIPGLTSWRFYEAKKHAANEGIGVPVKEKSEKRERFSVESLDHFIDFITSTQVVKDLPYGQRTLKLDSGEMITIPNVIRSISSSAVISQYQQLCEEEGATPLGKSTLYKILTDCAASVRKSVEGLDNYVMEGSRAFQALEETLDDLNEKDLKTKFMEAKRYLKADFKVHLAKQTDVLQHCLGFALSAPGCEFRHHCPHMHNHHCQSCIELDRTLQKIHQVVEGRQVNNKDALMFKVEKAIEDIKELQKHIVRSKNQELARKNIADSLETNSAMITTDWAMKFLPRRYREGQQDWFAKRGINWHVSVSLVKLENRLQTLTHLHIFQSQTSQDAATTTAVLTDVVRDLNITVPNLQKVHIFSDNAGCYKSSVTLSTLRHDVGPQLKTYNFSESQNGKGPCDRKAAHAKFVIKKYVNEGRDVTTAVDMKKALDKLGQKAYRVRVVDVVLDLEADKHKESIKNISSFYNFAFENNGLRMWQAYDIGEGKLSSWETLKPSKNCVQLKVIKDWTDIVTAISLEEPAVLLKQTKSNLICPMEGCIREFKNKESLDHHLMQGNCEYQLEKEPLSDKAKVIYSQKLSQASSICPDVSAIEVFKDEELEDKSLGWALKNKKRRVVFSQQQKNYMIEKFNVGKRTGSKVDAYTAAEEMRLGGYGFTKEEFLTAQQIGSFFSRLAQQDRKSDKYDLQAANDEDIKSKLKKEISKTIDL
ncbi:uncharacterized protein LOC134264790 [Saccostrea cucullata]